MNNKELEEYLAVIAKTVADQHLLILRLLAHQQAHLAAIRDLLVKEGEDRTMLAQRLQAAYDQAINLYHGQLEVFRQSGDAKKLLESLTFPDDLLGN